MGAWRYERGSLIVTSNTSFLDWGEFFHDQVLATAILDRLLHHTTTLNIKGESYRLKEKRRAVCWAVPNRRPSLNRRRRARPRWTRPECKLNRLPRDDDPRLAWPSRVLRIPAGRRKGSAALDCKGCGR